MKYSIKEIIITVLVMFLIFIFCNGIVTAENEQIYNNGQCSECNGEYNYIGRMTDNNSIVYYCYECNNCHKIIKLYY